MDWPEAYLKPAESRLRAELPPTSAPAWVFIAIRGPQAHPDRRAMHADWLVQNEIGLRKMPSPFPGDNNGISGDVRIAVMIEVADSPAVTLARKGWTGTGQIFRHLDLQLSSRTA